MNKQCEVCNNEFYSNGENDCMDCRIKSFTISSTKRNFYKDKASWNKIANENLSAISKLYYKPNLKHRRQVVDSNLNMMSDIN